MDGRGQISIEVVFFIAIVVVIVCVFASIMGDQNERNMVSSAVKLGAENATTNMVITKTGITPVRVTSLDTNISGDNENITVVLSRDVTDKNDTDTIFDSITQSLVRQNYTNTTQTADSLDLTITTGSHKHYYNIKISSMAG